MVLIVIDTQTHTQRTVMMPATAGYLTPGPARVLAYRPRS